MDLQSPITEIKGIGIQTAKRMNQIGVYTVGDILLHYPREYIRYQDPVSPSAAASEGIYAVIGTIAAAPVLKRAGRMELVQAAVKDAAGTMDLIWFGMPYVRSRLKRNETYVFYGKARQKGSRFCMEQPEIYSVEQYRAKQETLQPVYARTKGLSIPMIAKSIRLAFEGLPLFYDYLPERIRTKEMLCEYNFALRQIHFPDDCKTLLLARKRLVFDEFFLFLLNVQLQKQKKMQIKNDYPIQKETVIPYLLAQLPYDLTNAQRKCLDEIVGDLKKGIAMQRLVQGDVGSGKTIVAFLCMALMGENGYQSALMAPTEVLARQHYGTFCAMCRTYGLDRTVILLTGSLTAKEKKEAYKKMLLHPDAMIIGTQALIQEKTVFANLGLVVTDEQHRFGVRQRETLSDKGRFPHSLVMSATPIPRTLAIIIYGDMDISIIDEVPAKRLPRKNCVIGTSSRKAAYEFIRKEIQNGRQAYAICPFVEESEEIDGENVADYAEKLEDYFQGSIRIGRLNGRMRPAEKNRIMESFAENEISLLVSTTVVEVGVDVPNATVILIENAERFGLAQLHQLRGRVGRSDQQSYCIMVDHAQNEASEKRLSILNESNDGFFIAGEDLKLRGPGDFFGIRQSGELAFFLADIYQDAAILKQASEAAKALLDDDPDLEKEENRMLLAMAQKNSGTRMHL